MWSKIKDAAKTLFEILKGAAQRFGDDRASRMAAAVAYRAMFTLAPLLLIAVFALSLVAADDTSARDQILTQVEEIGGESVSSALETFLDSVSRTGDTAGIVGFALLLWTGSSLFLELQQDLNDIFGLPTKKISGLLRMVRQRLIGFAWSLSLGVILIVVWLINAVWRYLGDVVPEDFVIAHRLIGIFAPLASLILLPPVFALSFETLTRIDVPRRALWWGSGFTTIAFLAASYAGGLYFQLTDQNAASIAGSIFIILLLAFILSAVFFFGAEVTKTLGDYWTTGRIGPADDGAPEAVVAVPGPSVPTSAVVAFVLGLLVGRRRKD
ncbi:MAG TPA: YihY/virulence factor BrkB family protein [Acidimicrobiia bacterium]|nr:YihY/virulence factor BrkB family protein [Acidimicrobiia bacterium]